MFPTRSWGNNEGKKLQSEKFQKVKQVTHIMSQISITLLVVLGNLLIFIILISPKFLVSRQIAKLIVSCCERHHVPGDCIGLCMTHLSQARQFIETERAKKYASARSLVKERLLSESRCMQHVETISNCRKNPFSP